MNTPIWTPSPEDLQKETVWIEKQIQEMGLSTLENLAKQAAEARANSYAPYSKYHVGVALLSTSGDTYTGANAERASYSETDHAEEAAITNAIIHGEVQKNGRRFIKALAVSHTSDSGSCGRCRQIIIEHCDNAIMVFADENGTIRKITSLKTLLPYAFSPSDLEIE
jgi:cytidine deaminase